MSSSKNCLCSWFDKSEVFKINNVKSTKLNLKGRLIIYICYAFSFPSIVCINQRDKSSVQETAIYFNPSDAGRETRVCHGRMP